MSAAASPAPSKYTRYRERQKSKGLRELRMWVYDTRLPHVRVELARQAAVIADTPEGRDWDEFVAGMVEEDGLEDDLR